MINRSSINPIYRDALKKLASDPDFQNVMDMLNIEYKSLTTLIINTYDKDDRYTKGLARQLKDILDCIEQCRGERKTI